VILPNATQDNICPRMSDVSIVISLARSQDKIDLMRAISVSAKIPMIQFHFYSWSPPSFFNNDSSLTLTMPNNFDNYIAVVQPSSVFQYSIVDIFPQLNISTQLTVLSDDIYNVAYDSWKASFDSLGVPVRYMQMATNPSRIRAQLNALRNQAKTIVFVAKTENIEKFIVEAQSNIENEDFKMFVMTKDVTPFKCDDCLSTKMFWIRPYSTNEVEDIRQYQEFISKNEINKDMDYMIQSYEEMDISLIYDLMNSTFQYLMKVNSTYSDISTFVCGRNPTANTTLPLSPFISSRPVLEYGKMVKQENNYYYPNVPVRIFFIDRISSNEDSKYNKLMGNWTVETGVLTYYESLTQSPRDITIYRIATVVQPPFVQRTPDPLKGPNFEGYCKDLIDLIKENIGNFTYILYEVEDGTFGTMDDNGNWNGLMGALVSGSADIALAPLSVMAERENDVDFTVPYYDLVGTTILMKKNDVEYSLFKFMKVLEWQVWLCIVAAYVITSLLLWVFDRFSPYSYSNNKERYKDDLEKREFSLKECLWFCMTSLTPQGGGEAPKNISGRIVAATWWLFGFIIIASYTANLAAFLTVSRLEQPISSLDDLAKQYKIGYAPMKGSASETYFRRMAEIEEQFYNIWKDMSLNESMTPRERSRLAVWDYPVSDKFTNMWRYMTESGLPEDLDDAINRVLTTPDGFAFIGDATEIRYAELTSCNLQAVGSEFSRKPYAIAVQTGHPLKDEISSAILLLLNQRRLEALKEKWWNDNPKRKVCPDQTDESDGISIQNIGGVFIVILAGIVLSIVTLTFEYFYYRRATPVTKDVVTSKEVIPKIKEHQSPPVSRDEENKEKSRQGSVIHRRPHSSSNSPDPRSLPPQGDAVYENAAFDYPK
ncbi:glr-7, partial [Pristionchus pacificus]